jgi:hypothetical protein
MFRVGPCLCEHVCHGTFASPQPDEAHHAGGHAYGAPLTLTHHVRQISGDVCTACAAATAAAFPEEVTRL